MLPSMRRHALIIAPLALAGCTAAPVGNGYAARSPRAIHDPPVVRVTGTLVSRSRRAAAARPVKTDPAFEALLASAADQVRRCYRAPRVSSDARQIATSLSVRYAADGTLVQLPVVVAQTGVTPQNSAFARVMAEAAMSAVVRCAPISVPERPASETWTSFELTFSPRRAV